MYKIVGGILEFFQLYSSEKSLLTTPPTIKQQKIKLFINFLLKIYFSSSPYLFFPLLPGINESINTKISDIKNITK